MVLWTLLYWHTMIVVTSPINVVTQQCIIYLINWLLATVLMPKLAHTPYLAQHVITGLLLIGFVTVFVSATCILALTQFCIFVEHITEPFNLQWQLFFFAKL